MTICSPRAQRVTSWRWARSTTGSGRSLTVLRSVSCATPHSRRSGAGGVPRCVAAGGEFRPLPREGVVVDPHARTPTRRRCRASPVPIQRASRPARGNGIPRSRLPERRRRRRASRGATRSSGGAGDAAEWRARSPHLAYWGGRTQSKIATTLGIPAGTVKSRTFSALRRLRESLRQRPELTAVY